MKSTKIVSLSYLASCLHNYLCIAVYMHTHGYRLYILFPLVTTVMCHLDWYLLTPLNCLLFDYLAALVKQLKIRVSNRGGSRGVFGVSRPSLQKYMKEAKRVMYWYKNTLTALFLEISVISGLYIIKQPISSKGLHPPHPLLHIWLFT